MCTLWTCRVPETSRRGSRPGNIWVTEFCQGRNAFFHVRGYVAHAERCFVRHEKFGSMVECTLVANCEARSAKQNNLGKHDLPEDAPAGGKEERGNVRNRQVARSDVVSGCDWTVSTNVRGTPGRRCVREGRPVVTLSRWNAIRCVPRHAQFELGRMLPTSYLFKRAPSPTRTSHSSPSLAHASTPKAHPRTS